MSISDLKKELLQRAKSMIETDSFVDGVRSVAEVIARNAAKLSGVDRRFRVTDRLEGPWVEIANMGPHLWLHGASLGECKMLLNLAKRLRKDIEDCPRMLLTTQKAELVSPLKTMAGNIVDVSLAPADVPCAMEKFIKNVQPLGLILGENELWPGYLSAMSQESLKASVALVSGRYRRSFPGVNFSSIGYASMQTEADQLRLVKAAAGNQICPVVGGDWKLLPWVSSFEASRCIDDELFTHPVDRVDVAFLSVHFEEWDSLIEIIRVCKLLNRSIVLMPRRLEEVELFRHELNKENVRTIVWPEVARREVSIVDCFGKTKEILENCALAVVGGSFCRRPGIHDFWEPLQAMVPTCIGPYACGHEDVVNELLHKGVIAQMQTANDFENLDLPSRDQIQSFLDFEKSKILNSYQQLLMFLEDLLK